MEEQLKYLLQAVVFAAFIYAVIDVIKSISLSGIVRAVADIGRAVFKKNDDGLDDETLDVLRFVIALIYCKVFDFGIMTDMLHLKIADDNSFAWWLEYISTASVVYIGVPAFYAILKKGFGDIMPATKNGKKRSGLDTLKAFAGNSGTSGLPAQP